MISTLLENDAWKNDSSIQIALTEIARLKTENQRLKQKATEPIAIVGMACRFPKAPDLEAFWDILDRGVDAVTDIPKARWDIDAYYDVDPKKHGKMYTRSAALLDQIDHFDTAFFQINPREAMFLDPQHRLLLEVSWEALEDGAFAPEKLRGSRTGVYMGVVGNDYRDRLFSAGPEAFDPYLVTGNLNCIAVGRISYFLGLHGPSITIDSSCSSSLVAIQLFQGLISDLKVIASYRQRTEEIFDVPITVFHGENDDRVTLKEMQLWESLTKGPFHCHILSGDHFFLEKSQNQDQLLQLISQSLSTKL